MPNLFAMSFEGQLAPEFHLRCLEPGHRLPDGWGLGYYAGGEPSATVLKEPAPPPGSIRGQLARAWEHLESSLFVLHIRAAQWGAVSDANTQPFCRTWGRRDWLVGHGGSLSQRADVGLGVFEPVGSTDTEQVFCSLLNWLVDQGWRSLEEVDLTATRDWLHEAEGDGSLSMVLTDGHDLLIYADHSSLSPLHMARLLPPYDAVAFGDDDVHIDLTARGTKSRKGILVSSSPLARTTEDSTELEWAAIEPGTLLLVRQGAIVADRPRPGTPHHPEGRLVAPREALRRTQPATPKKLHIVHRTIYRYAKPVERSTHLFRMTPVHDHLQSVRSHDLRVSVAGQTKDYQDVFGNRVRRMLLDAPWTEMVIEAESLIELRDVDPLDYRPLKARSTIPLVWMPWQREAMQPFLLPPELPESQLDELTEYAMSFVERNGYDLLDTLLDINQTIFSEYEYRQNATTLGTTSFEVYVSRRGVCQDFTNLFICLARLLGVPARYVCGYVYTGPKNPNKVQSEASHAWVQLYLPEVGWKGFDPTNGILTQTDHVRVAVGRNYRDATPTSGTIYVGGGTETMEAVVTVEPVE